MGDGDSIVKYEAFTLPLALGSRNFLQVFEDTALEMVDVLKALGEEIRTGFFTTDAASAEHGDVLVLLGIELGCDVCGEFGEGISVWIDRSSKATDFDFIVVAGINYQYVGIGD